MVPPGENRPQYANPGGSDSGKKIILAVMSVVVTFALFIGAYEILQSHRYERWRSAYQRLIQQHDTLTVPSPNELLMWEYRPRGKFRDPELKYQITTNSYGFRDREYEPASKETNLFRVAFVGDSVTLGLKVSEESTFVRRFEQIARDAYPGRNIQAMNFGVDGYHVVQVYELLRTKVLRFSPDKVVYVMSLNDFDFDDASGKKILYFKKPRSFFLEKLEYLYKRLSQKEYHRYYFDKNKEIAFHYISKMRDLLEREKIKFQIVVLPIFERAEKGFENYPMKDLHRQITGTLTDRNIDAVDLMHDFIKQGKAPAYYAYDIWHPNDEGHRFIAQRLLRAVLHSNADDEAAA